MAPRDGKPSSTVNPVLDHGVINFLSNRREAKAEFMRVSHSINVPRLQAYMKERWRLPKPGIILHVTGSAQGFDLPPKHIKPITDGVVDVCEKAGAWVITGGLDAGVMALVGSAMSRWKHRCESAPLIGIAPWRAVTNKGVLENASGRKVEYFAEKRNDDESAALEANHTEFLLVDNPTSEKVWGGEIGVMESLQHELMRVHDAPTVLLVVQGGKNSLETLLRSQQNGVVAVIAADSGQLCSALEQYMRTGEVAADSGFADAESRRKFDEIRDLNRKAALKDELRGAFDDQWPLLVEFYLRGRDHIGEAVLSAVMRTVTIEKRLELAVQWDRRDLLEELLSSIPAYKREASRIPAKRELLHRTLQLALNLERPQMVQAAFRHGASPKDVDLLRLYSKLTDPEHCRYPMFYKEVSVERRSSREAISSSADAVDSRQRRRAALDERPTTAEAGSSRQPNGWFQFALQDAATKVVTLNTAARRLSDTSISPPPQRRASPPPSPPGGYEPLPRYTEWSGIDRRPPSNPLHPLGDGVDEGWLDPPPPSRYLANSALQTVDPLSRPPPPRGGVNPSGGLGVDAATRRAVRGRSVRTGNVAGRAASAVGSRPNLNPPPPGLNPPVTSARGQPPSRSASPGRGARVAAREPRAADRDVRPPTRGTTHAPVGYRGGSATAVDFVPEYEPIYSEIYGDQAEVYGDRSESGPEPLGFHDVIAPRTIRDATPGAACVSVPACRPRVPSPSASAYSAMSPVAVPGGPEAICMPDGASGRASGSPGASALSSARRIAETRERRVNLVVPPRASAEAEGEAAPMLPTGARASASPSERSGSKDGSASDGRTGVGLPSAGPPTGAQPADLASGGAPPKAAVKARRASMIPMPNIDAIYPPDVWHFLQDVVPGLSTYWEHKVQAKCDKKAKLEREGAPLERIKKEIKLGVRALDLYIWAVLLGNTELAMVILSASHEPMRGALLGAKICNHMADCLPIESSILREAASRHETFAVEMLDRSPNQQGASLMLLAPCRHWERNVLQLAVHSGMKTFVAHRHCQHFCDRSLFGDIEFQRDEPLHAMLPTRFQKEPARLDWVKIVLHAMLPVNGWTIRLRRSPRCGPDDRVHWHDFYRIPLVKKTLRFMLYHLYAGLFSFVTLSEQHAEMTAWFKFYFLDTDPIWVLAFWTAAMVLDEWYQWKVNPDTFETGMWNKYDYVNLSLTITALFLKIGPVSPAELNDLLAVFTGFLSTTLLAPRPVLAQQQHPFVHNASSFEPLHLFDSTEREGRALLSPHEVGRALRSHGAGALDGGVDPSQWYAFGVEDIEQTLFAALNVMVWGRVLQYYSMQQDVGVLIIMVIKMVRDMQVWMLLSAIFVLSFGITFAAITEGDAVSAIVAPLWAMYGEFEVQQVGESSGVAGMVTMWMYVLISNVLLVNLLIAMMAETYTSVKDNADVEWKFERVSSVLESIERTYAIPPPFSLPILAVQFAWWVGGQLIALVGWLLCCCGGCVIDESASLPRRDGDRMRPTDANDPEWKVGGRLYVLKREREEVAKLILQSYQRADEDRHVESTDGRMRRVEGLVEDLLKFTEDQERQLMLLRDDGLSKSKRPELARSHARLSAVPRARVSSRAKHSGGSPGGASPSRVEKRPNTAADPSPTLIDSARSLELGRRARGSSTVGERLEMDVEPPAVPGDFLTLLSGSSAELGAGQDGQRYFV